MCAYAVLLMIAGSKVYAHETAVADSLQQSQRGLSLRNNLVWDAAGELNLGFEIPLNNHLSLGANLGLKSWPRYFFWDTENVDNTKHWRNILVAPELRYWPGNIYDGWFIGADAIYTHFNVGNVTFPFGLYKAVRDQRMQGDFFGAGVFGGHSWWLGNHWRIEAEAGIGAGYQKSDKYECAHCGSKLGTSSGPVIIPKLGINLAYNFGARKRARREVIEAIEIIEQPVKDTIVPPAPEVKPEPPVIAVTHVPDYMGVAGELAPRHPVLHKSSDYTPYTPDRILRKEEGALFVFFERNKSILKRSFTENGTNKDNGPVLDEIMEVTNSIIKDSTSRVSRIQIIGLASVEGPLAHNQDLSDRRATALKKYIQERLPVQDSLFESVGGGEAWSDFRDIICDLISDGGGEGMTVTQLQGILEIIDSEPDVNARERKIKRLDGGKVYKALLPHILSGLRNSGYIRIYFDYVPDEGARKINEAIDQLEQGNADEALRLLEALKDDPRSAEARTAALRLKAWQEQNKNNN